MIVQYMAVHGRLRLVGWLVVREGRPEDSKRGVRRAFKPSFSTGSQVRVFWSTPVSPTPHPSLCQVHTRHAAADFARVKLRSGTPLMVPKGRSVEKALNPKP